MINEDNIDSYIAAAIRKHMMLSDRMEQAKELYEKLQDMWEDSDEEIRDLQSVKKSMENRNKN